MLSNFRISVFCRCKTYMQCVYCVYATLCSIAVIDHCFLLHVYSISSWFWYCIPGGWWRSRLCWDQLFPSIRCTSAPVHMVPQRWNHWKPYQLITDSEQKCSRCIWSVSMFQCSPPTHHWWDQYHQGFTLWWVMCMVIDDLYQIWAKHYIYIYICDHPRQNPTILCTK